MITNRYQPTQFELENVYTKTLTAHVLSLPISEIFDVVVLRDGSAMITLSDWTCRYIPKQQLIEAFGSTRKERSKGLTVAQDKSKTDTYNVRSQFLNKTYEVVASKCSKQITCTCPDFARQEFAHKVCKHSYAVLNTLGYSSLREFLN